MSAHTDPADGIICEGRRPKKMNNTVVAYTSEEQAAEAMLTNYQVNIQVHFDNGKTEWPYMGSFSQKLTGLPAPDAHMPFLQRVWSTFDKHFPIQTVYRTPDDCVVVVANMEHPTRQPKDTSTWV